MFTVVPQGLAFIDHAPVRVEVTLELPRTGAAPVFDALTDAEVIPQWWARCRSVRWTSAPPHHVGSERVVTMRALTLHQRVIAWQPGQRWAITVTQAGAPVFRSYVILVTLEPFDRHGTRVRWTVAVDETALVGPVRPALHRLVRRNATAAVQGLRAYLEGESKPR